MPSQLELDRAYLRMAKEWSFLSRAKRKQVGCIIGTPHGFDNDCEFGTRFGIETKPEVLHAESNAITKLAKGTQSSVNSTAYITLAPCFDCCKLMIQCSITRVVYGEEYRHTDGIELLKKAGIEVVYLP
jgi:dCMP deaminase